MNILLHVCCAPCAIYPVDMLRNKGFSVTAFFYNPNIHPYVEFKKRLSSVVSFCQTNEIPLVVEGGYQMVDFLRFVVFHEHERCSICQSMRIAKTLEHAHSGGFDYFTSSLLYSRYQDHDGIKLQCETLAGKTDVSFYYEDFRVGWQYGIDASIVQGLYRQPYCGCIYSEQERYDKNSRSKRKKLHVEDDCSSNEKQK